jgi:hypothetical protein
MNKYEKTVTRGDLFNSPTVTDSIYESSGRDFRKSHAKLAKHAT